MRGSMAQGCSGRRPGRIPPRHHVHPPHGLEVTRRWPTSRTAAANSSSENRMPPAIIAAGIAAVGTIGGRCSQLSARRKAPRTTAAAAQQQATSQELQLGRENINFQQGIYNQNKALLTPVRPARQTAGNSINALLGLGGSRIAPAAQPANAAAQGLSERISLYAASAAAQTARLPPRVQRRRTGCRCTTDIKRLNEVARERLQQTASSGTADQSCNGNRTAAPRQRPARPPQQAAQDAFNNFAHSAGMDFQLKQGENAINNNTRRGGKSSPARR
jgi:hypothetical protein